MHDMSTNACLAAPPSSRVPASALSEGPAPTATARLAVCLPITSKPPAQSSVQQATAKGTDATATATAGVQTHAGTAEYLAAAVRQLCSSMGTPAGPCVPSMPPGGAYEVLVLVGVDADDPVLNTPSAKQQLQQAVVAHSFTDVQLSFEWIVFPAGGSPATTSCNFTADADGTPSGIPRHTSSGHSNTAVTPNAAVAAAAPAPAPAPAGGGEAGRTPTRGRVCHLWSCMAEAAVWQHGCQLVVLLGDDTQVDPPGWAPAVIQAFERHPWLGCLLLTDTADPGFPSFPVLRGDLHLEVFGRWLPPVFVNQGGDPYLAELYRRVGATAMTHQVTRHSISVTNAIGGVIADQAPGGYTPPRYSAQALGHGRMLKQLEADTAVLRAAVTQAQAAAASSGIPTSSTSSSNSSQPRDNHDSQGHMTAGRATISTNSSSSERCDDTIRSSRAAVKLVGQKSSGATISSDQGDTDTAESDDTVPVKDQNNTRLLAASGSKQCAGLNGGSDFVSAAAGRLPTVSAALGAAASCISITTTTTSSSDVSIGRLPAVSAALGAMRGDLVSVDVLVPCYRVDTAVLGLMAQRLRDANHCTISTDDIMQETSLPPSVHSSKRAVTSSCPSVLAGSCPADAPTTSSSYSTTSSSSDSNSSSSHPAASCAADVHLVVVVDNPSVTPEVKRWLSDLRLQLQYNLRLRYHDSNQGASATRNRCLDESLAECVIFWDDDVMPAPGCIAAYVAAFKQHPEVCGFAGPTYLPRRPAQLWPTAVHMSGVSFFWTAPVTWSKDGLVPWAVTANVAFRNTTHRFDPSFPRTGGGEDIDFAIRAANAQLLAVPDAAAEHPWWRGGRRDYWRFWGWASGDGQLLEMYRPLVYRSCWSCTELTVLLLVAGLLVCGVLCGTAVGAVATYWLGSLMLQWVGLTDKLLVPWEGLQQVLLVGSSAPASLALQVLVRVVGCVTALQLTGLLMCVARNCLMKERLTQHPTTGPWWFRPAAAAEAYCIATFSELGRLAGHWQRHRSKGVLRAGSAVVQLMGQRFDWFCGMEPGVVAQEQRTTAAAFCVYAAVVVVVVVVMALQV